MAATRAMRTLPLTRSLATDMRRIASSCALSLLLAGCLMGPDYQRPRIDAPDAFLYEPQATAVIANVAWWNESNH